MIQTFREKPKFNRYVKGDIYETEDPERAEHLQKEGVIGPEVQEKPKSKARNTSKGKSDDPGGDVNESSKAEPKDTPTKEE
ncbi:hypothetical protein P4H35_27335 [Paenibacillus taichungensis]|uniref:hypothetical protein n=1 Tax=Paenibacillus taichungensis TaxID=484184 RepID=UPI002DBED63A|nr:hypothetical protein [Paenibacillus taichungensis]MEC0200085.1 hypothetical protein [Paenibacillus taichungensis]